MGPLLNGAHIYITISGALIYWAHLSTVYGDKFFFGAHIYITIYGALIYWAHLPTVYGDTGLSMGNTYTLQYLGHFSSKTFFNFLSKT